MKKKIALLCGILMAALPFMGCDRGSASEFILCDLPAAVTNLDPQYAQEESARMIIANICEGLYIRDENGRLIPGVAESSEASPDGKTYTFSLREGARWEDGSPVVADDFVFAFQRMFSAGAASPFAEDYAVLENAREVMAGTASAESLGVKALNEKTLEMRLARKSPFFLESLAETPAMPCKREFFSESRGRYGLDMDYVNANGPYTLTRWDNESVIYLRPNEQYATAPQSAGVNLYIGRENTMQKLQNGDADCAWVQFEDAEKLKQQGFSATAYEKTVWCVVFNEDSAIWGNPLLRQGLSRTIDPALLREKLPQRFSAFPLFIPPACTLAEKNYRGAADTQAVAFDPEYGRSLFEMGLALLSLEEAPPATLYVPDASAHLMPVGMVQQSWQEYLSAYINVQPATPAQIAERFKTGDYDMLLAPFPA